MRPPSGTHRSRIRPPSCSRLNPGTTIQQITRRANGMNHQVAGHAQQQALSAGSLVVAEVTQRNQGMSDWPVPRQATDAAKPMEHAITSVRDPQRIYKGAFQPGFAFLHCIKQSSHPAAPFNPSLSTRLPLSSHIHDYQPPPTLPKWPAADVTTASACVLRRLPAPVESSPLSSAVRRPLPHHSTKSVL
jgi:hypothetical protein